MHANCHTRLVFIFLTMSTQKNVAILDVETGGTNPKKDALVEIGMYITDADVTILRSASNYIVGPHLVEHEEDGEQQLGRYLPRAMKVHGITKEQINNEGWDPQKVANEMAMTINGYGVLTFIGHNVDFDIRFLQAFLQQYGHQISMEPKCTLKMAKEWAERYDLEIESFSLDELCKYFNITNHNPHRATGDVQATMELFQILSFNPIQTMKKMVAENEKNSWFKKEANCLVLNHANAELLFEHFDGQIDQFNGVDVIIDAHIPNENVYLMLKSDYETHVKKPTTDE